MKKLNSIKKVLLSLLVAFSMLAVLPSCGGGAQSEEGGEQTEEHPAEEHPAKEGGN